MTPVTRGNERPLYSNTLGTVSVDFGANRLISDDVSITSTGRNGAGATCRLTRLVFEVDGMVNEAPGQLDSPYTVTWALYNTCPYAVPAGASRNGRIVSGSAGSLQISDNAPTWIEIEFAAETPVYAWTNMWFGIQFSRANAGVVMGAPPLVGNSADIFDFPGSACSANLGGFPDQPHGSFNVEIWGDSATCPETYVAYRNLRESGPGLNAGSVSEWLTDDILMQNPCIVRGYTVGVRSPGTYQFELRQNCASPPVTGTQITQVVTTSSGQEPRVFEYLLDTPVAFPRSLSYAMKVNASANGAIVTGSQASIGSTLNIFERAPSCEPEDLSPGMDGLHFSVICDGPAPLGACCDMYLTTCEGGLLDGELCDATADCQPACSGGFCKIDEVTVGDPPTACTDNSECAGGPCSSTCKDVPQANCPFPPRFTGLDPVWMQGKSCTNDPNNGILDPWPNLLCGQAACCYEDTNHVQQCKNLTKDVCDLQQPVGQSRYWQPGRFCGQEQFTCPVGPASIAKTQARASADARTLRVARTWIAAPMSACSMTSVAPLSGIANARI